MNPSQSGLESSERDPPKPSSNEFCSVQFYGTISSHDVSVETGDQILICITVHVNKIDGVQSLLSAANPFGFVPVESIREKVHLAGGDIGMELLSHKSIQKNGDRATQIRY